MRINFRFPMLDYPSPPVFVIFSSKMDFIIKVPVDSFCKNNFTSFWSNRTRTLRPHHLLLTDSCHWEPGIYPLFHRDMPLFLVKFDDSLGLPFPPFLFACSLHVTCYFSIFWLYTGGTTFLGKSIYFLDQNQSGFYVAHRRKITHLLV